MRKLFCAARAGLLRQVPPGDVLPQQLLGAAGVNDAVTHDGGGLHAIAMKQRLAPTAVLIHDSTTAGADVVLPGIARGEQRYAAIHQQRHAAAQLQRSGEEGVARRIGF